MDLKLQPVPVQKIEDPFIKASGINLLILRLDLNHKDISGNKWYKLKYNLQEAQNQGKQTILTFGGAFSNHIAATAAAGKEFGFNTIGIIRGESFSQNNKTLSFAKVFGMQLEFFSREDYRNKEAKDFIETLKNKHGDFYLIPEGGNNILGVKGCTEILENSRVDFDHICCSCGTGTTLAGIILSLKQHQQAIGFSALKGGDFLEENVKFLLNKSGKEELNNWLIETGYHFGRYAKITNELLNFIKNFEKINHIPLEHVYTGKMMYGIYDLIKKGRFINGETILAIHSGGLQGRI